MATEKKLVDVNELYGKAITASVVREGLQIPAGLPKWADDVCVVRLIDIIAAPTVDAVEVVRCKDCGRHGKITLTPDRMLMCVGTPDCGYCHDAIRKEWKSND